MRRYRKQGVVTAIESHLDTDALTIAYTDIGSTVVTEEMPLQIRHEPGNERMFRQSVLIDIAIDEKGDDE